MQNQIRVTLLVAAALYMAWGLPLLLAPRMTHGLISNGPFDITLTVLFGAGLLGMMATFLIAAYDPEREIVRAAAVGMAFVGFTSAILMFLVKSMPLSVLTVMSVIIDLAACGMLFLTEARIDLKNQTGQRRGAQHTGRHAVHTR